MVSGGKFRVSGLHVPDMKKTGKQKCSKPARKKAVKTPGDSLGECAQVVEQQAKGIEGRSAEIIPEVAAGRLKAARRIMGQHGAGSSKLRHHGGLSRFVSESDAVRCEAGERRRDFLEAHYALSGLLERAKAGRGATYALDSFVTLLDGFCAELLKLAEQPPRGLGEAMKKVLAGRVRLPLNVGRKDADFERIKRLLRRYGVGLPHKLKEGLNFELQKFAAVLISRTKTLRAQIELEGPSEDDFQQRLARLSLVPDDRWRTLLRKAPQYFYGSDWFETEEHCAQWAKPCIKKEEKKKAQKLARGGKLGLESNPGIRKVALKRRVEKVLGKCVAALLKAGLQGE